jgi:hypothetical protein
MGLILQKLAAAVSHDTPLCPAATLPISGLETLVVTRVRSWGIYNGYARKRWTAVRVKAEALISLVGLDDEVQNARERIR